MQSSNIVRNNQSLSGARRAARTSDRKSQELVTKRQVRDMIRSLKEVPEPKFSSFSLVPGPVDYNGQIISLSDIDQGVTDSTRIGDEVYAEKLDFSYWSIVGSTNAAMRVILFQWKDLSVPAIEDVLFNNGGNSASFLSPYNMDEEPQRHILYDNVFAMNPLDNINHVEQVRGLKIPYKKIQFEGGSTDGIGKIYLLIISSNSANLPTLGYFSKLTFTDA
jgi:hypothetical protein